MRIEYVKLLAALGLLLITLFFIMLPLCLFRQPNSNVYNIQRRQTIISLLNCFGGGVFLATCLLHLFPAVQEEMEIVFKTLKVQQNYPASEFLFGFGFLAMLMVEQIILFCKSPNDRNETVPILSQSNVVDVTFNANDQNGAGETATHRTYGTVASSEHSTIRCANNESHSILRSMMLILALSLHSVFEGLAIGLQESTASVLRVLLAVFIHKSIIAFTLGLNLNHSDFKLSRIISSDFLFACMSPFGIVMGLLVMDFIKGLALSVTSSILQGIAAGTFLYVTLFEILTPEMRSENYILGKVLFLIIGYGIVSVLLIFLPG